MHLPKISIITPTLNQKDFLEVAIRSVLGQDYPNLEYIVVDGGSQDGSLAVLEKFSHKLMWISEPDEGQADAMNKGIRLATGEIIGVLNSDDFFEEDALKHVGQFFLENPGAEWLVGRMRIVNGHGKEIRRWITWYKNLLLWLESELILKITNFLPHQAVFIRRDLIVEVGDFDTSLYYTMDYDYWLRLSERTRLHTIPRYLAALRLHRQSKSHLGFKDQFDEEKIVLEKHQVNPVLSSLHIFHNWLIKSAYTIEHALRAKLSR